MTFKRKPGRPARGKQYPETHEQLLQEPSCYAPLELELMAGKELEDWLAADEYISRRTGQHG